MTNGVGEKSCFHGTQMRKHCRLQGVVLTTSTSRRASW